jgi:uncharacterized protein
MKLHSTPNEGRQLFSGYGPGYVAVNNVRYDRNVLVTPEAVVEWPVASFETLTPGDFGFIQDTRPEVLILGTGSAQRFPPPTLARALAASGAGVEIMDTKAACRTYNILVTEGRKVLAAILIERQ